MENSDRSPNARGQPFPTGQSGNPGGRPRQTARLRAQARHHTVTALQVLVEIAKNGVSESARIAAAIALLDRGWGRPGPAPPEPGRTRTFMLDIGPVPASARTGKETEHDDPSAPDCE